MTEPNRKYRDAEGYDNYMGGWSAALSPKFLAFVRLEGVTPSVVDIGCGTGNLLVAVGAARPGARLFGVDPSAALLNKARQRPELAAATLVEGAVERLPIPDRTADYTLSMLVLQEFADRGLALAEMRRVTRAGGAVAGCQWDFALMPVIDTLVAAIEAVSPDAGRQIGASSPRVFDNEAELERYWRRAGFVDIRTGHIGVERRFESFEQLWRPLLAGSTPSTLALASLPEVEREEVRQRLLAHFAGKDPGGAIVVRAEALVVTGVCA